MVMKNSVKTIIFFLFFAVTILLELPLPGFEVYKRTLCISTATLSYVWGVALDSSGNIYVTDTFNDQIVKFSSEGSFLTKWKSSDQVYSSPSGIAVDSSDNVYVAFNNRVEKFNSNGVLLSKWGSFGIDDGQFEIPLGIAVDSSGYVYVADTSNSRIQKFTSSGTFVSKWGTSGSGDGQLFLPEGIAVDSSNNVYVADTANDRIQKFTSSGTFVFKWDNYQQFSEPGGLVVDSTGNVYVADTYNNLIQKYNSNGVFLTKWGAIGSGDGQFSDPLGAAVDSSGNVYIADRYNARVQKFEKYTIDTSSDSINFGIVRKGKSKSTLMKFNISTGTISGTIIISGPGLSSEVKNFIDGTTMYVTLSNTDKNGGIYQGNVTLYPNPPENFSGLSFNIPVEWIANELSVSPGTLDFGQIRVKQTKKLAFSLTNYDTILQTGTITCNKDWVVLSSPTFYLDPGASADYEITVDNKEMKDDNQSAVITLKSDTAETTVNLSFIATCVLTKPNPYNPNKGSLAFYGDGIVAGATTIKIYTLGGELIAEIATPAGRDHNDYNNEITWEGKTETGEIVPNGIYLYTYESPREKGVGKFTVIR